MKRILIIKLSALGDIAQAEGAIRDIRKYHENDHLIIMTTPPYQKIMENCPWIDEVFIDARDSRWRLDKMFVLKNNLKKLGIDRVYDLQQVGRTSFYKKWLMNSLSWIGEIKADKNGEQFPQDLCMADRFTLQLQAHNIPVRHCKKSDLSWMAKNMGLFLKKNKLTNPYIVLIPGASRGHEKKRWPFFAELATWLKKNRKTAVTIPGPDELKLCKTFTDAVMLTDNERYLDVFELAGILKQAEFIIGNDTGPTHIGAYLNIPGLALFSGHTPPTMTGIQNSKFSWIEKKDLQTFTLNQMQEALISSPFLTFVNTSNP